MNRVVFLIAERGPLSVGVGTLGSFGFFPCFALLAATLDCLVAAFLVPLLLSPVAFGCLGTGGDFFDFFLGGAFAGAVVAERLFPVPRGRFFFWEEVRRVFTLLSTTSWSVGMLALGSASIAVAVALVAANVSFFAHLAWTLAAASCCC